MAIEKIEFGLFCPETGEVAKSAHPKNPNRRDVVTPGGPDTSDLDVFDTPILGKALAVIRGEIGDYDGNLYFTRVDEEPGRMILPAFRRQLNEYVPIAFVDHWERICTGGERIRIKRTVKLVEVLDENPDPTYKLWDFNPAMLKVTKRSRIKGSNYDQTEQPIAVGIEDYNRLVRLIHPIRT